MSHIALFAGLTFLACGYALWRGGAPERVMVAIITIAAGLSDLVISQWTIRYRSTETGLFLVDGLTLGVMLLFAVQANRFWPIAVCGLQMLAVAAHLASIVQPGISPKIYAWSTMLGAYPMLALLVIGTCLHQRRLRLTGSDRSWVGSYR